MGSGVVVWIRGGGGGLGGGRVPSFWWDAGEPMGMTVKRLPALGPQAEGLGPPHRCSKKWEGQPVGCYHPPNRMLHVVTVTTESVKCSLTWNVKLQS